MAKSTPNTVFEKFVTARKAYRQSANQLTFKAYAEVVTDAAHDTSSIEAAVKGVSSPSDLAVHQQALDFITASKRAVELRNKTFLDYVQDARAASSSVDNYEDSRVMRHRMGRF